MVIEKMGESLNYRGPDHGQKLIYFIPPSVSYRYYHKVNEI